MAPSVLSTLVTVEPGPGAKSGAPSSPLALPAAPKPAATRTYPAVPQQPDYYDRDGGIEMHTPLRGSSGDNNNKGGGSSPLPAASAVTTPRDERDHLDLDLEARGDSHQPGTPMEEPLAPTDAFEVLPGWNDPPMNKYRIIGSCLIQFLGGLTDSAPGALIPYMEEYYDIGYATVSLIFVGNALGFICAAPFVDAMRLRFGRARTLALSQLAMVLGYLPFVCAAPFAAVACSYFLVGWGFAVSLAINNVFGANMRNGTTILGLMHGTYGVGGTVGPLIATALASSGVLWSRYYLITLAFAAANAAYVPWAFWSCEKDMPGESNAAAAAAPANGTAAAAAGAQTKQQLSGMLRAFRSRVVLLGALFIFAYQGSEVSISGWVISFLITSRGGDPGRVGYVTAGFWGGITAGRFALSPLGARFGEKRFTYALVSGAAVFQLLVWLVPNVVGEAVSLAIVGLLLGPVYPCAAAVFARNLSRDEQVSGLGVISAFGSSGGAVAPFAVGALAQAAGTFVLHPVAIGLFGVMMATWYGQPGSKKRTE